jgi:predicted MFS family arabinose efflux permease
LGAGVIFGIAGAPAVIAIGGVAMALATVLMLPLAIRARRLELASIRTSGSSVAANLRAVSRELAAGFGTVLANPRLAILNGLMAVTIGTLGALSVLIVIVAIDVLGFDEDAAGYLTAAGGLGALLGSALASSLVGRERLATPLLAAVLAFAVSVAAVGLVASPVLVVIALIGTGVGWSAATVAATTLTQRIARGQRDDPRVRGLGVAADRFGGRRRAAGSNPGRGSRTDGRTRHTRHRPRVGRGARRADAAAR